MRYKIGSEGEQPGNGKFWVVPGALVVEDDRVFIVKPYGEDKILGYATDFKVEDGFLTAEVTWLDVGMSDEEVKDHDIGFSAYDVHLHRFLDYSFIDRAVIKSISFIPPGPRFPKGE